MATQTLSETTQRWVAVPTESGSFALLENAADMGDTEEQRLAFWRDHVSYADATLATVRITTTIEPDDA